MQCLVPVPFPKSTHAYLYLHVFISSSQSDPFVEIAKVQEGGGYTIVYRSAHILKTLDPKCVNIVCWCVTCNRVRISLLCEWIFAYTTRLTMHDYLHVHWLSCIAGGLGLSCLFRSYAVEIGTGDCVFLSGTGTGKVHVQTHLRLAWHRLLASLNFSISSACTSSTHCIRIW